MVEEDAVEPELPTSIFADGFSLDEETPGSA
jgi:hypothetical protein